MVLNADVSPPGSHTVRIVASFGEDTVSYIISDTENDGEGLIIPCRDKFKMTLFVSFSSIQCTSIDGSLC